MSPNFEEFTECPNCAATYFYLEECEAGRCPECGAPMDEDNYDVGWSLKPEEEEE